MIKKVMMLSIFAVSIQGMGMDYGMRDQPFCEKEPSVEPRNNHELTLLHALEQSDFVKIQQSAQQIQTISQSMHHQLLKKLLDYNDEKTRSRVLDILISRGVQLDIQDADGLTPLHYVCDDACKTGDVALLELFLHKGADCFSQGIKSPYQVACNNINKASCAIKVIATFIAKQGPMVPPSIIASGAPHVRVFHQLNSLAKELHILRIIGKQYTINTLSSALEILLYDEYFKKNPLSLWTQEHALQSVISNQNETYLCYFFIRVLMCYGLDLNIRREIDGLTSLEYIRKFAPQFVVRHFEENKER